VNDPKQLLGIKGASETSSIWKLRLQLMKPITWIPLIWGVICGAAASGNFQWTISNVLASLACMLMSGPLLAGYTQTINDFFVFGQEKITDFDNSMNSFVGCCSLGTGHIDSFIK